MDSGFKVLQEMAHLYETIGNDMVHNMPRTDVSDFVMRLHIAYIC